VRRSDFESLVRRLASEIPAEFLEGVAEVVVSPRSVPHPDRDAIWTLGECIPLATSDGDPRYQQSRIVLYHGSFQALADGNPEFDWPDEAWETLTHEVRHHVEWKAGVPDLEAFDRAAEANFARQDGEWFDPVFYRDGLRRPDGSFQVDDDVFLERTVRSLPERVGVRWAGRDYLVEPPAEAALPAFLTLEGLDEPPPGELVLVIRKKAAWSGLFRRTGVFQATVEARPVTQ
jgi:predicted Zn-dependent protease with MMP-like domain